jgi:hypothetical protein
MSDKKRLLPRRDLSILPYEGDVCQPEDETKKYVRLAQTGCPAIAF